MFFVVVKFMRMVFDIFACFLTRYRYTVGDFHENGHKTMDLQKRQFWTVYRPTVIFGVCL